MAKRRCFSVDFFENEKFLMMNDKSKVLYFGLVLHSDDDGAIINPTAIMRLLKKQKKYFDELVENGFIMQINDVYFVKHWCLHNKIQPSKKTPTMYKDELAKLYVNQANEYELKTDLFRKKADF